MIYLVRKKLFRSKEGMKQLYYAVQRTLQPRGGVTTEKLAQRMAHRKGMSEGDVQSGPLVGGKATPKHGFLPLPAEQVLPPRNAAPRNAGTRTGTYPKYAGRRSKGHRNGNRLKELKVAHDRTFQRKHLTHNSLKADERNESIKQPDYRTNHA